MSLRPTDPLLLAGRVLTYIMQAFMALGAVALTLAFTLFTIFRDKVDAELVQEFGEKAANVPALQILALIALAIGALVLIFRFFGKLRRIIETVEEGDPFVPDNADRLTAMAWHLTAVYSLAAIMGLIAISIAPFVDMIGDGDSEFALGFDLSAIMMIIVLFILARVFRKGTEMRDDLEGTV